MPSVSKKQARMMAAAAHDRAFAARVGVPQSVAKEYNQADAGHRYSVRQAHENAQAEKGQTGQHRLAIHGELMMTDSIALIGRVQWLEIVKYLVKKGNARAVLLLAAEAAARSIPCGIYHG